ncbi:MAG: AraC family transcriptional regulator [Clostridia bacterium]|nr:AraC family transcriptional regulator [Clostridia bacterium]
MDRALAEKLLTAFHSMTKCGVLLAAPDGEILFSAGPCGGRSCDLTRFFPDGGVCAECLKNACYGAERFGGRYVYSCPAGMIFSVCCVNCDEDKSYIVSGPVLPDDTDGAKKLSGAHGEIPGDELLRFSEKVPKLTKDEIDQTALLLSAVAAGIGGNNENATAREENAKQNEINDYIQSIRSRILLGVDRYKPYPYDKEKLLTQAIAEGNEQEARKYLNELLGHIFFASADDLDAIKIRAMELTVVISRAALEGGADPNNIYNLNLQFVAEFFRLASIEDVCFALVGILNKFTEETFGVSDAKHASLLSHATAFIKSNYMHKITLADVAGYVYISPSYLSKLFREELNVTFSSYLNTVRTEKSKILLMSDKLSIIEVAELVGFVDQSYFNKVFKRLTGMTPKRFRECSGSDGKEHLRHRNINGLNDNYKERSNSYGNT